MDHYIFRTIRTEVHAGKYIGRSSAYRRCNGDGGRGIAACRLLSWTRGGITDYSLSRPICQAARTTRSQALYCKIKWLACGARPGVHVAQPRRASPHRALPSAPGPAWNIAVRRSETWCTYYWHFPSKNYVFFILRAVECKIRLGGANRERAAGYKPRTPERGREEEASWKFDQIDSALVNFNATNAILTDVARWAKRWNILSDGFSVTRGWSMRARLHVIFRIVRLSMSNFK